MRNVKKHCHKNLEKLEILIPELEKVKNEL